MRGLILGVLAVLAATAVEAQGLRNTLARCARAAGPKGLAEIERVEMLTLLAPHELAGARPGTPLLTFEMRYPDGSSWEVICNGETGDVVDLEREVASADDPLFRQKATVAESDARRSALEAHPGRIQGVEYEVGSDGTPTYEFLVTPATSKGNLLVEVSGTTGRVTKVWGYAYTPTE